MYIKQVIIYKDKLTKKQESQLKKLLKFDSIKINGKIVIRTKQHVEYTETRHKIKEIMNCKDGEINCTLKHW